MNELRSDKSAFLGGLQNVPILRKLLPQAPKGMRHAGELVDMFAAFVSLDNQVGRAEAEVALDLLRHAFPEADHGWLSRRMHRALDQPQKAEVIASGLKDELSEDERVALGMQLFLLVDTSRASFKSSKAFQAVMQSLNAEEAGDAILNEMRGKKVSGDLPFDRVKFAASESADVLIPDEVSGASFYVYRSTDIIIIRNIGQKVLSVSGSSLEPGQVMRLGTYA